MPLVTSIRPFVVTLFHLLHGFDFAENFLSHFSGVGVCVLQRLLDGVQLPDTRVPWRSSVQGFFVFFVMSLRPGAGLLDAPGYLPIG
jgi:hypothetical protein